MKYATSKQGHTFIRTPHGQNRAHKMPTLRQKKLPRDEETLRSLRLRRKPTTQTLQLAKQEAQRTPTQLDWFILVVFKLSP
jgi:hypothetical protein